MTRRQVVVVRKGKVVIVNRATGKTMVVRNGSILVVRGANYRVVGAKVVPIKKTR